MEQSLTKTQTNPCMDAHFSCSACCGIFNLKSTNDERAQWIQENTKQFLALDISNAETIVRFRKDRETATPRVREDIYVCPFVGFMHQKTGCLLHPEGSPHPQIGLWQHPQNFSFYGEGICLSYDCIAKQRQLHRPDFFHWAKGVTALEYGRLASDHTLHRALAAIGFRDTNLSPFYDILTGLYARYGTVTTSFEDIEKATPSTSDTLCQFLAERITGKSDGEIYDALRTALPPVSNSKFFP